MLSILSKRFVVNISIDDAFPLLLVLGILRYFLLDPRYVFGHVSVDSGQFWVGAFYAPADDTADKPSIFITLILTQQRPSGIALEEKK